MFERLLGRPKIDADLLFAFEWKKPDTIEVVIKKADQGYFAKVINLEGNVVTQATDGMELVEMVNEAVYDFLDIPVQYRPKLGYFMPPADVREQFKLGIPRQYLDKQLKLVKA